MRRRENAHEFSQLLRNSWGPETRNLSRGVINCRSTSKRCGSTHEADEDVFDISAPGHSATRDVIGSIKGSLWFKEVGGGSEATEAISARNLAGRRGGGSLAEEREVEGERKKEGEREQESKRAREQES